MKSKLIIFIGTVLSVMLMVLALRMWERAPHEAFGSGRPELVLYAARTTAVATAALAQVIILLMVVGNLYRKRGFDALLRTAVLVVFTVTLVGAIALALAARN